VFPAAPHPVTRHRQLQVLAFEVVSTQRLSDDAGKAAKLAGRGVRRAFAIDLRRGAGPSRTCLPRVDARVLAADFRSDPLGPHQRHRRRHRADDQRDQHERPRHAAAAQVQGEIPELKPHHAEHAARQRDP